MSEINNISKAIAEIVKESQNKGTEPYDTTAEVVRVEEGTAWVHIPGGVDETPAKMTVDASPGDNVQVRVADGRAWLTGNASAPPTDDTRANVAYSVAVGAGKAAGKAQDLAEEAQDAALQAEMEARAAIELIGDTPQYFWHEEEGTDTGSHITEIPKEEFQENPSGGNTLIRSTGVAIRQALTELALFMSNLIRLGPSNGRNVTIDTDSVDIMDNTTQLATFGTTTRIGTSGGRNVTIGSSTVDINNGTTNLASFGTTSRIGTSTGRNVTIGSSTVDVKNGDTVLATFGASTRVGQSGSSNVLINSSGIAMADSEGKTGFQVNTGANVTTKRVLSGTYTSANTAGTQFTWALDKTPTLSTANPMTLEIWGYTASSAPPDMVDFTITSSDTFVNGSSMLGDFTMRAKYDTASNSIIVTCSPAPAKSGTTFLINIFQGSYIAISKNTTTSIESDPPQLNLKNTASSYSSYIRAYDAGQYGNDVVFKSGGHMIIGGGEYPANLYNEGVPSGTSRDDLEGNAESLYLGADKHVYIEANGDTIANRKTWRFGADGKIRFPNNCVLTLASDITGINFGDGSNTGQTWIWGNATNKVGVGAYNYTDSLRYNWTARANAMYLFEDGTALWSLTGLSGTINLGAIGTVSQVSPNAVSVASGTVKNLTSRTLAAGTWLVIGSAQFAANATGRRAIQLSTTSTGDALYRTSRDVQSPVNGAVTICNFTTVVTPTESTTYYLNAYQNSGSALSTEAQLQCIRIK